MKGFWPQFTALYSHLRIMYTFHSKIAERSHEANTKMEPYITLTFHKKEKKQNRKP
uniref:Uncharacterized protein n=1 Tax=Anguilla anguilla TaxID=7936 RepID=A0A0E9WAA1_ANGAN